MAKPPARRTIGNLMVAVVLAAIVGSGWSYIDRRAAYRRMAEYHVGQTAACEELSQYIGRLVSVIEEGKGRRLAKFDFPVEDTRDVRQYQAELARKARFHADMSLKYQRAANQPWTSVDPDPPSP